MPELPVIIMGKATPVETMGRDIPVADTRGRVAVVVVKDAEPAVC